MGERRERRERGGRGGGEGRGGRGERERGERGYQKHAAEGISETCSRGTTSCVGIELPTNIIINAGR